MSIYLSIPPSPFHDDADKNAPTPGNEDQTGKGIAAARLARDDMWVTSKLWNTHHRPADAAAELRETLDRLGLDRLDLYLMHWPVAQDPDGSGAPDRHATLLGAWRAMEDLARANLTRHIGVSNFARRDVQAVLDACDVCPYAHELEAHPYLQQQAFVDWHAARGIRVVAYSPLGNTNPTYSPRHGGRLLAPLLEDPFWVRLAARKGVSPAQAVLAWGVRRGTTVIPKSTSEAHLLENVAALDIDFTDEEMRDIAAQDKKARFLNPSKAWGVQLFADLDDHELDEEDEL